MESPSPESHILSRRTFLRSSAAVGIGALAAGAFVGCSAKSTTAPTDSAWNDLSSKLRGTLLRPGSTGFEASALPDNLQYASVIPAAVAMCATPEDVATALRWCRENGVAQVPRSGGHNYAGYSTTTGLLIRLSDMNQVQYDKTNQTITTAGGAFNRDVGAALTPHKVMTPGGQCLTVGVAGLTLGGGLGFSMRSLGLTSDNLIASTMVLADGTDIVCSSEQNPEAFWGIRGGAGGNFGINTSFTFRAHEARNGTHFNIEFPLTRSAKALAGWFAMLKDMPRSMSCIWYALPPEKPGTQGTCGVVGLNYGDKDNTRDILAPVMTAAGKPSSQDYIFDTYFAAVDWLAPGPSETAYMDRSRFIQEPWGNDEIAALADRLIRRPAGLGDTSLFAWGGAIADTPADATAFVHRSQTALIKYSAVWNPGDAGAEATQTAWVNDTFTAMQPYSTSSSFQNFPDAGLNDWADAYYGANLPRLSALKQQLDPERAFNFPQAIPQG